MEAAMADAAAPPAAFTTTAEDAAPPGAAWLLARGLLSLAVPVFPAGSEVPFGPVPLQDVLLSLAVATAVCSAAGYYLTRCRALLRLRELLPRHADLRDEAFEDGAHLAAAGEPHEEGAASLEEAGCGGGAKRPRAPRRRTVAELLFIVVHNAAVSLLAAVAWAAGSPRLALHAFSLEVAYEIFDTFNLGPSRLEPESLIHHIVSPICILCSSQTTVDFRVLCHVCFCIDSSGAVLGYSKFLLRYAHVSANLVYLRLAWIYFFLRVLFPLIDYVIIVWREISSRGGLANFAALGGAQEADLIDPGFAMAYAKADWTQLYIWAMTVLTAFNIYFFCVIRARGRMPSHAAASFEARTGACR